VVEAASRIRADIYFMGVTGVHAEAGLSTGDLEEADVKRALSTRAAETIVLASAEKLNAASPYVIALLSQVSGVIVEAETPEEIVADFRRLGITVTRAS
jgi:DeoR/GlpR family transcriptional regulator of sugar metabolism